MHHYQFRKVDDTITVDITDDQGTLVEVFKFSASKQTIDGMWLLFMKPGFFDNMARVLGLPSVPVQLEDATTWN